MKTTEKQGEAGAKGERVREAIGKALSTEKAGVESDVENAGGSLADRERVPASGASDDVAAAAQKRLAEIEARVGELVQDSQIIEDAKRH